MNKTALRCIRCMQPMEAEGRCTHCGMILGEYKAKPHQLPPKSILKGQYLVGCVLGEGGFGITYVGWDLLLDMMVAIKEYYPVGFVNRDNALSLNVVPFTGESEGFFEKGRERFLNEAKNLALFFANPGIVSVRDYFTENNTGYIVMEYIQGINLATFYQKNNGKVDINTLLDMLDTPLNALEKVHQSNLIHRDISPENLMVSNDGTVKLIDFGASKVVTDERQSSVLMLRPGYAPYEMYQSDGKMGPWTDVYEICATLYKGITGVVPPEAPSRRSEDKLVPPSKLGARISPAQERALLKGLAVKARDRYANVAELRKNLVKEVPAPKPKKKLLLLIACLCAVVALCVGGVLLFGPGRQTGVRFENAAFERGLRSALGKQEGDPITNEELLAVTKLTIQNGTFSFGWNPEDVTYVAEDTGLVVYLGDLKSLPNLTQLYVANTRVLQAEAIGGCTGLTSLMFGNCGLTDCAFTADLTMLLDLYLYDNQIADCSMLPAAKLVNLGLSRNPIESIDSLRDATSLQKLYINNTAVADLSPLSGLPNLTVLYASDAQVTDWSPVAHVATVTGRPEDAFQDETFRALLAQALGKAEGEAITQDELAAVTELTIRDGRVLLGWDSEDVGYSAKDTSFTINLTDLQNLPSLTSLYVVNTCVIHAEAIGNCTGLTSLMLGNCGLTDCAFAAGLTKLLVLYLYDNQIADCSMLPTAKLVNLGLSRNPIESIDSLRSAASLRKLYIKGTAVADLSPLSGLTNLTVLDARDTQVTDWSPVAHVATVTGRPEDWDAPDEPEPTPEPQSGDIPTFKSVEFCNLLRTALDKASGEYITREDMEAITTLAITDNAMYLAWEDGAKSYEKKLRWAQLSVSDLQFFPNLRELYIANVELRDTDALASLSKLKHLWLLNCGLKNCAVLSGLRSLTWLYLNDNPIDELQPLSELRLGELSLKYTSVETLEPLKNMNSLKKLYIDGTKVTDLEPLRELNNLTVLSARDTQVTDWSPVANVTNVFH